MYLYNMLTHPDPQEDCLTTRCYAVVAAVLVVVIVIIIVVVNVVTVTTTTTTTTTITTIIMPLESFPCTMTYQLKTFLTRNNISTLQQANLISLWLILQLWYCVTAGNARP
jgi:hypothetical protein